MQQKFIWALPVWACLTACQPIIVLPNNHTASQARPTQSMRAQTLQTTAQIAAQQDIIQGVFDDEQSEALKNIAHTATMAMPTSAIGTDDYEGVWQLVNAPSVRVSIDDGDLRVSGACNSMWGKVVIANGALAPNALHSTRMACQGIQMRHENAVRQALSAPLILQGDTLVDRQGRVVFIKVR